MVTAQAMEIVMAKDPELPGVPAAPDVTAHPLHRIGAEHGMLLRLKRRCSIPTEELMSWNAESLEAFKAGVRSQR